MLFRQTNAGIWTWVRWGWLIALVMPGCESVLGLDKLQVGCIEGTVECAGNTLLTCEASGEWRAEDCGNADVMRTCRNGACIGECKFDVDRRCVGDTLEVCNEMGQYEFRETCATKCDQRACVRPSCLALAPVCGALAQEDCCATEWVEGGTFDRGNNPAAKATVSNFRLDRFEVTVGRFRQFVEKYPASRPVAGAGAHPKIPDSGWKTEWPLLTDKATFEAALLNCTNSTFPSALITVLERPVNCVTWYEAFAFCAWEGGWLPTEAEWNMAAAREGAAEHNQRVYPWSNPFDSSQIDSDRASYDCMGDNDTLCNVFDILKVGTKSPAGNGPWNHADLGGNVAEWTMDSFIEPYVTPCEDCAPLLDSNRRVVRGGSWASKDVELKTFARDAALSEARHDTRGFRCAYEP